MYCTKLCDLFHFFFLNTKSVPGCWTLHKVTIRLFILGGEGAVGGGVTIRLFICGGGSCGGGGGGCPLIGSEARISR